MATADRLRIAYKAEGTYGVVETGTAQVGRITAESLAAITDTSESAEIRDDRQIAYVARTGHRVNGDLSYEMSYGTHEDLMAAALYSAGMAGGVNVASQDATFTTGGIGTQKVVGSASTFSGMSVGQWFRIAGTTKNNGIFKIHSKTGNNTAFVKGRTIVAETALTSGQATYTGANAITNGVTQTSFTMEKTYSDLGAITAKHALYTGMVPDSFSVNLEADSMINCSMSFIGQDECSKTADQFSTYTAANENRVTNTVDDITIVNENMGSVNARSLSFQLNNNSRTREVMGTLGPLSIGEGTTSISGSFVAYYENADAMDRYLNFTDTSLNFVVTDGDENVYIFEFPRVVFTAGTRVAGGQNSDIMAEMNWFAYRDPTEDVMIRISKIDAAT